MITFFYQVLLNSHSLELDVGPSPTQVGHIWRVSYATRAQEIVKNNNVISQCDVIQFVVKFLVRLHMWYCKNYLQASTEVDVDWRKQKISDLMWFFFFFFFADFVVNCDCLHKNDHWFSELFIHFSLMTVWSRAQANHKGEEKYIFHCFGDECCPKWDFEKLTIVSITRCQSLYSRDLLASLASLYYIETGTAWLPVSI